MSPTLKQPVSLFLSFPLARLHAKWFALSLIFLAFALRTYRLGHQTSWWDEGFSVFLARMPLAEMLDATAHDTHPPGYYALLHFWRMAAGDSEVAVRLPSALAGVLLLPLAFRLVRPLAGTRAALCALGLLSLSRVLIWYSQEVRQYALAACLALASVVLAVALWQKPGWIRWLGYIAVNVAGLLTLYLFSSALVAQNLAFISALWFAPHKWRRAFIWFSAQLAIGLACLPWVMYYLPRAPHHFTPPTTLGIGEVVKLYANTLFVGNPSDIDRYWGVMLLGGTLLLAGGILVWRVRRRTLAASFAGLVLLAGIITPPALVWLLNLPTGLRLSFVPNPRYFVALTPWAMCALGLAIGALTKYPIGRIGAAVLAALWWGYAVEYLGGRYLADDFKSVAATLAAYRQPADVVFLHNDQSWPSVAYHLGGRDWIGLNSGRQITSEADAAQLLEANWNTHTGAWLLLTPEALINDPDRYIYHWLETRALAIREFRGDPAARLFFFARTPERTAAADVVNESAVPPSTFSITPAPGLTLVNAEWLLPEYRQGDALRLYLYWRNEQAVGDYPYELRLTTFTGQTADAIPATLTITDESPTLVRQQVDFPVRAYVTPGAYMLNLAAGPTWGALGRVAVAPAQAHWRVTTQPAIAQSAHFENGLELLGYTLQRKAGRVSLTLYWTTTAPIDARYKFFAHVWGESPNPATGANLWAQIDREPNFGAMPVTTWRVGEIISDNLEFDLPSGVYTLSVGWYDFFTGQRLFVLNEAGEAVDSQTTLGPFTIENAP